MKNKEKYDIIRQHNFLKESGEVEKSNNIFRTLATEYMESRLVNSSLVKYSLFCIVVLFKYNIQIKVTV